jgi:hypothetical protein
VSAEEITGWAALAAAIWLALLIVHPVHRCPRCRGRKVTQAGTRFEPCKRCKGTGKAYRRGAIVTHRLIREHGWPWLRDRINDVIASRTGGDS